MFTNRRDSVIHTIRIPLDLLLSQQRLVIIMFTNIYNLQFVIDFFISFVAGASIVLMRALCVGSRIYVSIQKHCCG